MGLYPISKRTVQSTGRSEVAAGESHEMGPTDGGSRRLPFIGWSSKGRFAEYGLQRPKAAPRSAGMMHEGMVNPYDIERTADAIRYALEMEPEARTARMQRLRKVVREQNIYRWAGNPIGDLCDIRLEIPRDAETENRVVGAS